MGVKMQDAKSFACLRQGMDRGIADSMLASQNDRDGSAGQSILYGLFRVGKDGRKILIAVDGRMGEDAEFARGADAVPGLKLLGCLKDVSGAQTGAAAIGNSAFKRYRNDVKARFLGR